LTDHKRPLPLLPIIALSAAIAFAGCGLLKGGTKSFFPEYGYTAFLKTDLDSTCISCHNQGYMQGGYAVDAYASLFAAGTDAVPNVITEGEDREARSLLYSKLEADAPIWEHDTHNAAVGQLKTNIFTWIQQGAEE